MIFMSISGVFCLGILLNGIIKLAQCNAFWDCPLLMTINAGFKYGLHIKSANYDAV